jgi:large subunit ribosomal protein L13e
LALLAACLPRPLTSGLLPVCRALRPVVRPPTRKYNTKLRLGRGFTLEELKEAGITAKYAATIGIAVDHRRRNKSVESFQVNVARLQEYLSKLVVFPSSAKAKKEANAAELAAVRQLKGEIIPVPKEAKRVRSVKAADVKQERSVYAELRRLRADAKFVGIREKRKREAEEAAKQKKKKK